MKKIKSLLNKLPERARIVVVFAICGLILLGITRAASSQFSTEAENADITGGISIESDSSASSGQFIKFGAAPDQLPIVYPGNSGVVNVKNHGVKGDGVTDDTAAIQTLIESTARGGGQQHEMLYFPEGTYIVSNTLAWKNSAGEYMGFLSMYGAGRSKTIIKLKDSTTGFDNPSSPKAVLYTASSQGTTSHTNSVGDGNEAYRNNIANLTVDTGTGNTGAIGISYLANNRGLLRDVLIKGGGVRGLDLTRRYLGPCLISDVEIDGFNIGIDIDQYEASVTLENISLRNQTTSGIKISRNSVFIRKLNSVNQIPAVTISGDGSLVNILDSQLTGTGGTNQGHAIVNAQSGLLVRNVESSGYASLIESGGNAVSGNNISEYVSHPVNTVFSTTPKTLNLPVKETPKTYYTNDFTKWASVTDFGATPRDKDADNHDDGPAIQAAIDSGKPIIYFPRGYYHIRSTVFLRGNVKAIYGFESEIRPTFDGGTFTDANNPRPLIKFTGGTQDYVSINKLAIRNIYGFTNAPGTIALIHAAPGKALSLIGSIITAQVSSYQNETGAGDLFLEDVQSGLLHINNPQNAWARQLNIEMDGTSIINEGTFWVFGLKTERAGTKIHSKNSAKTELLGGAFYLQNSSTDALTTPLFVTENSASSLSFRVYTHFSDIYYDTLVRETIGSSTYNLMRSDVKRAGYGSVVPLYVGQHAGQ